MSSAIGRIAAGREIAWAAAEHRDREAIVCGDRFARERPTEDEGEVTTAGARY